MDPPYRRLALGVTLALCLLGMVPGVVFAAQPVCGQTLTSNTTLTADLDCSGYAGTALHMGANGVVLNLNGHTLWGPVPPNGYTGVDTDQYNRTTVRNGKITDYGRAVHLDRSNRTTVSGLDIDGNDTDGAYGVYEDYGVNNVLSNLEVSDVSRGAYLNHSAGTTLKNSDLTASSWAVYLDQTSKTVVTNNSIHSADYGIYDYEGWRNKYSDNTANGGVYGFYIQCDGYGPVTMSGNTANNNSTYGFYLTECYEVGHPVIGYTGGSHITGNTANNNSSYGFYSDSSYNEVWKGNVANDNDSHGFYWDYPSNARIVSNSARRNDGSGFYIDDNYSYYNVDDLAFNTARGNGDYGFYAGYGAPSHDNVAVNNSSACSNIDCN